MLQLLGLFLLFSTSLFAQNLQIRNVSGLLMDYDAERINLSFELINSSNQRVSGKIRLQPFLVPEVVATEINGFKPIVLESTTKRIDIAPGSSQIVSYSSRRLPLIPNAIYHSGALYTSTSGNGSNGSITSNLSYVGPFAHSAPSPLSRSTDIYSDVGVNFNAINGRMSHRWRLSWRGNRSGEMRVIFFVYDPALHKVYPSTYEKGVRWVNMGRDYDARGRQVPYDVYSQAPSFDTATPGSLFLWSWVNYTKSAGEKDYSNNIDARKFVASYFSQKPSVEIWKTFIDEDPTAEVWPVSLGSQYGTARAWSFDRGTLPSEISLNTSSGNTSPSYQLMLENKGLSVSEGTSHFSGTLSIPNLETKIVNLVISKFVSGNQPVLEVPAQIAVSATSPFAPEPHSFVIKNNGVSPLEFKLQKNNDWIFFSTDSGTIAPGEEMKIVLNFSPNGIDVGNTMGSFVIHNNSVESQKVINVTYSDQAP
jgi:hypothetical protein